MKKRTLYDVYVNIFLAAVVGFFAVTEATKPIYPDPAFQQWFLLQIVWNANQIINFPILFILALAGR